MSPYVLTSTISLNKHRQSKQDAPDLFFPYDREVINAVKSEAKNYITLYCCYWPDTEIHLPSVHRVVKPKSFSRNHQASSSEARATIAEPVEQTDLSAQDEFEARASIQGLITAGEPPEKGQSHRLAECPDQYQRDDLAAGLNIFISDKPQE